MPPDSRKHIVRTWVLQVWGEGNFGLVDELIAPQYVYRAPGDLVAQGSEAITQVVGFFRTAFPDLTNTIDEQIEEGETVVTRGTSRGTHRAPFGGIPATGRSIAVPWVLISHFHGEKIVEDWEIFDQHGLLQQLGASPASAGA